MFKLKTHLLSIYFQIHIDRGFYTVPADWKGIRHKKAMKLS